MTATLQHTDPNIEKVEHYSKFVVTYLLQQDGPNPGWRKANIEGPLYLLRRRTHPRFQLLVKNQFSSNDHLDSLQPGWELDCQQNYVFYKTEDPTQKIRGLWLHDDNERQLIESRIEKLLREVRTAGPDLSTNQPQAPEPVRPAPPPQAQSDQGEVRITKASLQTALRQLASDESFVDLVMQKLTDAAKAQR